MIHQINTLFTSIEKFVNDNYKHDVIIEKVTGSRLHLIINGEKKTILMIIICKFAYSLSKAFKSFAKYSNLDLLNLQFGADVGYYCETGIKLSDDIEYTTIGYPANYAAKLQSASNIGSLYISEKLYDLMNYDDKNNFEEAKNSNLIKGKYNNGKVYCFKIDNFDNPNIFTNSIISNINNYIIAAKEKSNDLNYNEMLTVLPNTNFTFENWSVKNISEFKGTVVYADMRGFTKEFKSDGSNLETLVCKTIKILNIMYNKCIENKGIHIQFQGDREYVLFPNELYDDACIFAIKLVSAIKKTGKHIGIGVSYGKLFGFKIGIRGSKDNVMLGVPSICADKLEDLYANEDCISIADNVYDRLKDEEIKALFNKKGVVEIIGCQYYTTTLDYGDYTSNKQKKDAQKNPDMSYTKLYGSFI